MAAQITLVAGPAGSGKTQRLLAEYRGALAAGPIGAALWLAPARRNTEQVRLALLDAELPACFRPQCYTFGQFALHTLAAAREPLRPLNRLGQREILRRLATAALRRGALEHFSPIAHTPGFLDLLARFIRELKRLEVWPEELAARLARSRDSKLQELAGLYAEYQAALNQLGLFDPEGRFWAARRLLRDGQTRPYERLRAVFVDGFTDFTRTEHEILEILAERVERLVISLPLESATKHRELFAKTAATRAEFLARHGLETVETIWLPPNGDPAWPAMRFVERYLFRLPAECPPAPPLDGFERIVAPSARAEIEEIAARIKRLLAVGPSEGGQPVRAGDILVVFRSLDAVEELVREVFLEYGLPLAIESRRALGRCGVLSAITSLLRLAWQGWTYRQALAMLSNGYLRPDWAASASGAAAGDGAQAAAALVRALQIPRGERELLTQAAAWERRLDRKRGPSPSDGANETTADAPTDDETSPAAAGETGAAAERAWRDAARGRAYLEGLSAALAGLPTSATPSQWADAIAALGQSTGVAPAGLADGLSQDESLDARAWRDALAALRSLDRLSGLLLEPLPGPTASDITGMGISGMGTLTPGVSAPRELSCEEFWTLWQDILRLEPLPDEVDDTGRVRVLSAPAARGLAVEYLFLAGLGEQAFPLASGDHSLLSDADVSDLIAAGVPLPARADRSRDEMLLFYQSLTRPRRGLFLSYAALDAKAQPLMPSPYLQELAKLCGDRWPKAGPLDLSPLPTCAEPMCERDLRLLAVAGGVDGNVSLLAELLRGPGGSIPAPAGAAFADRVAVGQAAPAMPGKPSPRATARASSKKVARQTPSDPRRALADNLRQGLLAHDERRGPAFGAFDGLLLSDRARATLSARFGPASLWSASQLEQYVTCPFEFFLSRILRLEPLEELELSADYLRRGRALHGALAGLHRRVNERAGRPAALGDAAQTLADAAELLAELCKSRADEPPLERALREIDRRVLETALGAYHEQQEKYEKQLRSSDERLLPAHFEVSFGSPLRTAAANAAGTSAAGDEALPEAAEAVDLLSTAEPYRFDCGEETVLLRGRIDRIDVAKIDDRVVFSVLDYKSGRAGRLGKNAVSQGLALQLPLYALAASDLLLPGADAALLHGGYWFLKGSGYAAALEGHEIDRGSVAATDEWLQLRKDLAGWVLAAVRSVRNGQFPVASRDDECTGRCPYRTVCRVNQVRSLHKIWPPPAEPPRPDA